MCRNYCHWKKKDWGFYSLHS